MFASKVKAKLAKNEVVHMVALHLTDAALYEMVGLMGFDCIWVDMEHHVFSLETVQDRIRAARLGSGADTMVRPAKGEFMHLARMLEAGASGIMYPRCSSAEEARRVVQAMKFHPLGIRGFDGGNRDMPFCSMPMDEYTKQANEQTFLLVQIEEPEAVEQAEDIAAVEGVDGLFFGPADFSVLSNIPGQMRHPLILDAREKIAKAAERAGKHWGTPAGSVEHFKELKDMGAKLIPYCADIIMVRNALEQIQQDLGELGLKFDNQMSNILH